jgi:hypothetical protein
VESSITQIGSEHANEIATEFLRQHYSIVRIEKTILKNTSWLVDAIVLSFDNTRKVTVEIKATTGSIISWY